MIAGTRGSLWISVDRCASVAHHSGRWYRRWTPMNAGCDPAVADRKLWPPIYTDLHRSPSANGLRSAASAPPRAPLFRHRTRSGLTLSRAPQRSEARGERGVSRPLLACLFSTMLLTLAQFGLKLAAAERVSVLIPPPFAFMPQPSRRSPFIRSSGLTAPRPPLSMICK